MERHTRITAQRELVEVRSLLKHVAGVDAGLVLERPRAETLVLFLASGQYLRYGYTSIIMRMRMLQQNKIKHK